MINLDTLSRIWNVIVESNTFNFIIFIMLFALIFKKINLKAIIESVHQKIVKLLDETNNNHEEAYQNLLSAEHSIENLADELNMIIADAEKSAKIIGEKILTEAKKQLEDIESNAEKIIEAEEKMIVSKLTKSASHASVELAKIHTKKVLAETPTLHEKYINESIDELDRLNI